MNETKKGKGKNKSKNKDGKDGKENNKGKKKKNSNKIQEQQTSNVIYIGHIPPAFEETQILTFFSQFGQITNVKLSRSKRTGNPRGYAFVEFDDEEVASIVADTMSGYFLMGERRLVCHVVPKDKIHPKLFQGAKRNLQLTGEELSVSSKIEYWRKKERDIVNKERSIEGIKKITKKLLSREKKKREQLKALGIDYDFPGYAASLERVNGSTETNNEEKKRKVSVDGSDTETGEEKITPSKKKKLKKASTPNSSAKTGEDKITPSKTKKSKKTSTPNSNSRKISIDKDDNKNKTSTPGKKVTPKKLGSEKKKSAKKRRKSVA
jgi:nucleolar protein 15